MVKQNYLIPFNITSDQVVETVTHQDEKKVINFSDYTVILFLKKFNNHYLFVDGRWKPLTNSLLVASVFIVDKHIIQNIGVKNPLAVLEQFANEFGYEIGIGGQKSKFIHDARIAIPHVDSGEELSRVIYNTIKISDNGNNVGSYTGDMLVKVEDLGGGRLYLNVSLAYFISVDKYSEYLKSNNYI
jgi:hypothetical protein